MLRKTLAFCIVISIVAIASLNIYATEIEKDPTYEVGSEF
jgi:hypothetical protein